jgi:malonyl-CoA O-methyltransferase
MFTTFGPDTLQELRSARSRLDRFSHVHAVPDMHDLGDRLVASGLSDPVMDMEHLTLTYASFDELIAELRATCGPNAARGRPRGLTGKTRHRDLAGGVRGAAPRGPASRDVRDRIRPRLAGPPGCAPRRRHSRGDQTRFPAAKIRGVARRCAQRYTRVLHKPRRPGFPGIFLLPSARGLC